PMRRGMAKLPAATCINTSLTDRTSFPGRQLYLSDGMACASLVSFVSASSIKRVASARGPVATALALAAGAWASAGGPGAGVWAAPDACPKATRETETRMKQTFDKATPLLLALMVPSWGRFLR